MMSFLAISFILTLVGTAFCQDETATKKKPHVLFIPVDDLNNWVGYTGANPQSKTPNFDRLAKMGVAFTNAHASSTICNPSRAAVWSGTRPSTTGCYDNRDTPWTRFVGPGLGLNAHFKKNGYYTAARGKTYHSSEGGIDKEDSDTIYKKEWNNYPKVEEDFPTKPHPLDGFTQDYKRIEKVDDKSDADYHTVDFCARQLDKAVNRDQPIFLACGIIKPHLPWVVPQKYYDMYPKDEIVMPGGLADTKERQDDLDDVPKPGIDLAKPDKEFKNVTKLNRELDAIQSYLAAIAYADMNLGRLIDAYEKFPEKNNTIVVLWSDHGYHLGQKKHWKKQTLWEEASDVPFIWIVPGVTNAGGVSARPVDLQSIYPTLCDLVGLPIPEHVDGDNIRPLLEDPMAEWDGVALTTMRYQNHAVRDERYRYIRYYDGSEELYDHQYDPHEFVNRAKKSEYKPIKQRLRSHMPEINMKIWYDGQTCVDDDKQHIKSCPDGTKVARDPNKKCSYMSCPKYDPLAVPQEEDWNEDYDPRPEEDETVDAPEDVAEDNEQDETATAETEEDATFPVVSVVPPDQCNENTGTVFYNARGLRRECEWLTRTSDRVEEECSPGLAFKTDADKACPISCKKCKPSSATLAREEPLGESVNWNDDCDDTNDDFVNQRGQTRSCAWLQRDESRIELECSTDELGIKTDADEKCPSSCGKCAQIAQRM